MIEPMIAFQIHRFPITFYLKRLNHDGLLFVCQLFLGIFVKYRICQISSKRLKVINSALIMLTHTSQIKPKVY
ncbi:hypothetical protein CLU79DRAFT_734112 [Phycomyces nitens]|nr:hypothetical protein CLU79DRAFT_734112 [Phycomyces nitens]